MRIMYVNDAVAIWGGLERILVDKANCFADNYGYEVHIVTTNQGNHAVPYTLSSRVYFHDLNILFHHQFHYKGLKRFLIYWKMSHLFKNRMREQIEQIRPDIIISLRMDYIGYLKNMKRNIPLVLESHFSYVSNKYEKNKRIEWFNFKNRNNRLAQKVQMLVALTQGDAYNWRRFTDKVCVIPNMVHLNDTETYSFCSSKKVIYVGRFSRQKDIDSLLKIWKIVNSRHPDWELDIYGGFGEYQNRLIKEIGSMNANISIFEPTPKIMEKYKESSILLLTSLYEPFGLVLPEAMSCGLPVVSFDCPYGPGEIITDGVDGYLIKNRSISDFAEKVCKLIENPKIRMIMGKAGINSSMRYHYSRIMPQWIELFDKMIK